MVEYYFTYHKIATGLRRHKRPPLVTSADLKGQRVLVVDDSEISQDILRRSRYLITTGVPTRT